MVYRQSYSFKKLEQNMCSLNTCLFNIEVISRETVTT